MLYKFTNPVEYNGTQQMNRSSKYSGWTWYPLENKSKEQAYNWIQNKLHSVSRKGFTQCKFCLRYITITTMSEIFYIRVSTQPKYLSSWDHPKELATGAMHLSQQPTNYTLQSCKHTDRGGGVQWHLSNSCAEERQRSSATKVSDRNALFYFTHLNCL